MQVLKISVRIAKIVGKAILGLLLILISAVAIIHLPPIQKQITRAVSNYLSTKIAAKVSIQRIEFSILGHVIIEGLTVWNRVGAKIASIDKIEVTSSFFDFVTGHLIFDEVRIVGLSGQLTQDEKELNIQFIIDAFRSTESSSLAQSGPIKLQFKNLQLENTDFEFTSARNGISVANVVGILTIEGIELSTLPTVIKANKISLQRAAVNILTSQHPKVLDQTDTSKVARKYSGSGILIKVMSVVIGDSDFSFHQDESRITPKFDPNHITLQNINIGLSDILVGVQKDTVAAALQSLSVKLPGFQLDEANATLRWSHEQLMASGLHISNVRTQLDANFDGGYDLQNTQGTDHAHAKITAMGRINTKDLSYFLSDSVMKYFNHWESTDMKLESNYSLGIGHINTLNVKTGNSQLDVSGTVGNVLNLETIYWNDLAVNASIGEDFKRTLTPFLPNINTPSNTSLQLKTSGSPKKAFVNGKVFTNWGMANIDGQVMQQSKNAEINVNLTGEQVDLGNWVDVSSLGAVNFTATANGMIGPETNIDINGSIGNIELMDRNIRSIDLQSNIKNANATVILQVNDPDYKSKVYSEISFQDSLAFTSDITLNNFKLGNLLHLDSTLNISGNLKSELTIHQSTIEGKVESDTLLFQNPSLKYFLDTLAFHAFLSPTDSEFEYYSDDEEGKLTSNFDVRNSLDLIRSRLMHLLKGHDNTNRPIESRALEFNLELKNAKLFQLLGIEVNDFSSLHVSGEFDEQKQTSKLQAAIGNFKGYGLSLDTLNTNLTVFSDSVTTTMDVKSLFYHSLELGNLNFDILTKGDTAHSNLRLSNDTITTLDLRTRILLTDSGAFIYPVKLHTLDHDYLVDSKNPIYLRNDNVVLNHFQISQEDMHINLDGDLNTFDVSLQNVDVTPLNLLLAPDSTIINKGILNGEISYSPRDQQLNLKVNIDSLSLYKSNPLTIEATAVSDGVRVPFEFLLMNTTNKIDLKGRYNLDNTEVDATIRLDINNPEIFTFLVSGVVDEMSGSIKGETKISGPLQKPAFNGNLQFHDVEFTTVNPQFTFKVQDDDITLDKSSILFNDFTLHDTEHHPLIVDGNVATNDYESISYDLQIKADDYTLMNKPDSASGRLKGVLVIDSDIKLKGNQKDTNVEAKLTIKDNTHLTFVSSTDDIELLTAEGIVDFVDPTKTLDSALNQSVNFYDSLIASLPEFNLNSTVRIEDGAKLRIVIDARSGDYMETSGGAVLDLSYDRTGNLHLVGDYRIKQGVYRLSFYDLVKRNFSLVPNSSIHWTGSPEDGDLNIKAIHTVPSNSIGLIGHEIGENEKSIYKRSLDYEVGININGTIDKPIVSFSLDLPQQEKTNYPVLANKLERLRQPEFQSELNKQVFGLLVLGGFLPETSGSDINSSQVAATALSNSVNSLLAGQLNRFASQYIKGVNIDVGIQSYADYSAPSGKTQTAMDFRVSKRIMDDRLSFEIGGDFDISTDQSGANKGTKNYRGDIAIVYDLTGNGDKQLKLFNNETYDIVYQEIRNTGISLIFIREFSSEDKKKRKKK